MEVRFKLHFKVRLNIIILAKGIVPVSIDQVYENATDFRRCFVITGFLQGDKYRIGIAVNHFVALGFDQFYRLQDNFMTTFGDRTGQARIVYATTRRSQHTVKGIHDDFDRLR